MNLPYLKADFAEVVNQFKIGPIRSDQTCAMGASGECNQHVEVQITQFAWCETASGMNSCQDIARLQPIFFRGSQNWMISRQSAEEFALGNFGSTTPQLRQDNGRGSDQSGDRSDSLLMTSRSQVIDKDGSVEEDEVTHSSLLIGSGKLQLARVLLHQVFEALERDDLAQRDVNGFGAGFRSQDFHGLVCQVSIETDGCHGYGHLVTPRIYTY